MRLGGIACSVKHNELKHACLHSVFVRTKSYPAIRIYCPFENSNHLTSTAREPHAFEENHHSHRSDIGGSVMAFGHILTSPSNVKF